MRETGMPLGKEVCPLGAIQSVRPGAVGNKISQVTVVVTGLVHTPWTLAGPNPTPVVWGSS